MQSSEVLELLIEILVLQVTVLNEVLSQWDVHSSSLTNYMCSAAAFSVDVCHTTMWREHGRQSWKQWANFHPLQRSHGISKDEADVIPLTETPGMPFFNEDRLSHEAGVFTLPTAVPSGNWSWYIHRRSLQSHQDPLSKNHNYTTQNRGAAGQPLPPPKLVSKQLLIYTCSRYEATLAFTWQIYV